MMPKPSGLQRCKEAYQRLIDGCPNISDHVGVTPEEITPAMVSIEAGFDKGYLKGSRESHKPLIALIKAGQSGNKSDETSAKERSRKALRLAEKRKLELEEMQRVLDSVLTQNLILVERIRELEGKREVPIGRRT